MSQLKILFLIFLVFLSSCNLPKSSVSSPRIFKKTFISLGTLITVSSPQKEALDLAYDFIGRISQKFNYYNPESEISLINKNAGLRPVKVSKEVFECIKLSKKISEMTEGYFDPTVGVVIDIWKEMMGKKRIKNLPREKIKKLQKLVNYKDIILDEKNQRVFLKRKGEKLDLGGIAKGYIVDKTILYLKARGINSCLIDAGGDIYALGKKNNEFWRIGIKHPRTKKEYLDIIPLKDEALATSGDYEQFFYLKGERFSHIIDPKTGYPCKNNVISVSVKAKNLTTADSLSTAFFVMGRQKTWEFLNKGRNNLRVYLVEEERGRLHTYIY